MLLSISQKPSIFSPHHAIRGAGCSAGRVGGRPFLSVPRARTMSDATIFSPAITLASIAWRAVADIDGDDNLTRQSQLRRVKIAGLVPKARATFMSSPASWASTSNRRRWRRQPDQTIPAEAGE